MFKLSCYKKFQAPVMFPNVVGTIMETSWWMKTPIQETSNQQLWNNCFSQKLPNLDERTIW